jgi:hypothetical protein
LHQERRLLSEDLVHEGLREPCGPYGYPNGSPFAKAKGAE